MKGDTGNSKTFNLLPVSYTGFYSKPFKRAKKWLLEGSPYFQVFQTSIDSIILV
jgi:hypothetical protein